MGLAGMAGIEPANMGAKTPSLTAWQHPYVFAPDRNVAAFRPGTSRLFRAVNWRKGGACLIALEPVTGLGPAFPAWKAGALPLSYTDGWCRECLAATPGGCRSSPAARKEVIMRRGSGVPRVVGIAGVEPAA